MPVRALSFAGAIASITLRPPGNLFNWKWVLYFSTERRRWYQIPAGNGFEETLLGKKWTSDTEYNYRQWILRKSIGEGDLEGLASATSAPKPSFADDMISASLVDLKNNRIRSAIVHAAIAYESAAKHGLGVLLAGRLKGLKSGAILEDITKKVGTVNLGRIVLFHAHPQQIEPTLNWDKIKSAYQTRNQIVHCGRRNMPPFEEAKSQILEMWSFVLLLQSALRDGGKV